MPGRENLRIWLVMAVFLPAMVGTSFAGPVIYVDCNAPGPTHDGNSWPTAFKYLQDGLAVAQSGDEIWVAEGVYKPDEDTLHPDGTGDREATFQLINGVALYGGFPSGGGEWADRDPNDPNNETILSGDLYGDDGPVSDPCDLLTEPTRAENSYHVVTGSGTDSTAVIDGFTIIAGNANGSYGGGMFNYSGSPTVSNCTFSGNSAEKHGGGMYNYKSSPTLVKCAFIDNWGYRGGGMYNRINSSPMLMNCTFIGNSAEIFGGGMFNYESSPVLDNCTYCSNSAKHGGGMRNYESSPVLSHCDFSSNSVTGTRAGGGGMSNGRSSPTVKDCTFVGNSATGEEFNSGRGGGMSNVSYSNPKLTNCTFSGNWATGGYNGRGHGGGMYNYRYSDPNLTNCTFDRNSATDGGGMKNYSNSEPNLMNCTFDRNSATYGGGMYNYNNSTARVTNCIFWGDAATFGSEIALRSSSNPSIIEVSYCDIEGGETGVYVEPNCTLIWGLGNIDADPCFVDADSNDYHLLPDSPCIDAGDPSSYFGLEPEPDGGRINMGAYGNTPEATCKGGLVLQSYNRVSKIRIGRTLFDYEFTVTLNNNSVANACNVQLELLDASDNVVIIDPEVSFAYIAAGESATSEDTFALQVDRSVLIDATIISWRATFEMAETGSIGERIFTTNIILETVSGDITGDGNVNYEDLAILAEQWLGPPDVPSADIAPSPADGVVNFLDFAVLANNWGYEKLIKFYDFPLDVVPAWTQGCDWEFGQPTGGGGDYGNPDPTSGYTGLNVYGVNLNGDYGVDPDFCYLQTELLDCSGYHNVHLRFARWLNTDAPPWVASKIEASDDGVNWHYVVWEHTGSSPITDDSWQIMEYDISGIADGESTVCIRWSYQILKGGAWQCSGWNIDDIELWGSP